MLKVTNVWVNKYASGKLLGFADVAFSLDGSDSNHMVWKNFKIFQGNNGGIQIGLPQRKDEEGKKDEKGKVIYYPLITITREEEGGPGNDLLEHIRAEVETAYHKKSTEGSRQKSSGSKGNTGSGVGDDDVPF